MKFGNDTIGGNVIIEAPDYEDAVRIVGGCIILESGGAVEIREIARQEPSPSQNLL
jgi:hypothetical protein